VAEHLLRRRIEQHDALLLVHGEDGVHRRIDDGGQARLAADRGLLGLRQFSRPLTHPGFELIVRLVKRRLRPPATREIAADHEQRHHHNGKSHGDACHDRRSGHRPGLMGAGGSLSQ